MRCSAGLLTEVRPPTPEEEAVRDLCRARDDARADLQRCRHRLGKLLLRRGLHFSGRNCTRAHRQWVDGLTWLHDAERVVVEDYWLAIDQLEARLMELDARIRGVTEEVPFVPDERTLRHVELLTLETSAGPLDVMTRPDGAPPYEVLRRNAERVDVDGFAVLVASIEDLIAMKHAAGRDKDKLAVRELEAIRRLRATGLAAHDS